MILKEYQQRALAAVRGLLDELARQRDRAAKVREIDPEWNLDWAREAWEKAVPARPYNRRTTSTGEPLPSFCLKIPTGGGKTLLATRVIDLVHSKLLHRQTGLVLWIVPTTQIYRQTLAALKDRDHPYRQQLDLASAGRTMVLEENQQFPSGRGGRQSVHPAADAPVREPRDQGATPHVPRQRRLRSLFPRG